MTALAASPATAAVDPGWYHLRSTVRGTCVPNTVPTTLQGCGGTDTAWVVDTDGTTGYRISYDGQCLNSAQDKVWLSSCDTGTQYWDIQLTQSGTALKLTNVSGRVLSVSAAKVLTVKPTGAAEQSWTLVPL
ncbi:hypothetical protein CLV40_103307 [Actinokineospora auranticolor]|uniref:Ricin B lectin domain-containing protein n=2 Tax=Actinokineospora auranticolor TaxID=155976 RepID=A0A2S6GWX2_9PSEU|nr:hypothetical protein CLV40_103307 [Actinokineospora auranticolor]